MAIGIGDIEVPRASDVLAERLRRRILEGALPYGTWLPTERELAADTQLSRGTVRDALRVLEAEGLVETRTGRNGGTVVRRPDASALVRSLNVFVRGRGIRMRSLLEIRELIEPECAALAAERRTDESLAGLEEVSVRLTASAAELPAFLDLNVQWHVAIAEASHNELLGAFMQALSMEIRQATDVDGLNSEDVVTHTVRAHARILDAIRAQDPDAARRRMQRHVCAYRDSVIPVAGLRDHVDRGERE